MTGRRTFDQHVALLANFAGRVAELTPPAWKRLRVRCAPLNGPAFAALVRRALLAARPYELWLPRRSTTSFRVIAGASRGVQRGLALAFEVAAEFEASDPRGVPSPRPRVGSTGKPRTDAYIDAWFSIDSALTPFHRTDPGVVTVVRAAGHAVLKHDWMSPANFDSVYGFIEPEIPFEILEGPQHHTSP